MRRLAIVSAIVGLLAVGIAPALATTPPSNDDPSGAIAITGLPFTYTEDTTAATSNASDPSTCESSTNTVWFTYNAGTAGNGHVILDASSSTGYPLLHVATGSPTGAFVTCGGSRVEFAASPSTTYYIMVGDWFGGGGTLVLNATQGLAFTGTVSPTAPVTRTGVVTVTGTYQCTLPSTMLWIEPYMTQTVGRLIINGYGWADLPGIACVPGNTYSWSAQLSGSNGRFAGGKATVLGNIAGQNESETWFSRLGPVVVQLKAR